MSKTVFITLEKSGSQWVRDVLCDPAIVAHSGVPPAGVSFNLTVAGRFDLPDGRFSGPVYAMNRVEWLAAAGPGDKALVVLRDPRDRLVSLLHSWLYSHAPNAIVEHSKRLLTREGMDQSEQLLWLLGETAMHIRFYLSWVQEALPPDAYLLRYEELLRDETGEFAKLLDWLGWQVPAATLAEVAAAHTFSRKSGRPNGTAELSSHYRRGVAGDWRNYFTRRHGRAWEMLYPGFLQAIGYEDDDDWWRDLPENPDETILPKAEVVFASPREIEQQMALRDKERELQKKESVIRALDTACRERLQVIEAQQARMAELQAELAVAAAGRPGWGRRAVGRVRSLLRGNPPPAA